MSPNAAPFFSRLIDCFFSSEILERLMPGSAGGGAWCGVGAPSDAGAPGLVADAAAEMLDQSRQALREPLADRGDAPVAGVAVDL